MTAVPAWVSRDCGAPWSDGVCLVPAAGVGGVPAVFDWVRAGVGAALIGSRPGSQTRRLTGSTADQQQWERIGAGAVAR